MPLIASRGSGSAQGLGFSVFAGGGGVATVGIFALGPISSSSSGSNIRNKYTFATCASTACGVGVSSCTSAGGAAAGNSTRIIFQLGRSLATRNKYTYATCASTSATPNCSAANNGYGVGNSTRGIFTLGSSYSDRRNVYTYATDTSVAVFNMLYSGTFAGYGTGNSTRAIIQIGIIGSTSTKREKYTYACCTSTCSGVASSSVANAWGAAQGTSTQGIFQIGYKSNCATQQGDFRSNKYTYATCTSVSGACATYFMGFSSAAGNDTRGIFALGQRACTFGCDRITASRCKYTYATNTRTMGGVGTASTNSYYGAAASFQTCVNS